MSKQKPRFLVGVEYYRAPVPPQAFWEEDFAAIRKAGLRLIRTFSYWNWMEPQRGVYELDDFDRFFELAAKKDAARRAYGSHVDGGCPGSGRGELLAVQA